MRLRIAVENSPSHQQSQLRSHRPPLGKWPQDGVARGNHPLSVENLDGGPTSPITGLNRPMSAHFHGFGSLRASVTIFVSRFESRPTQLRGAPFGRVRLNISITC
jgi:hypothetical protein